MKEKSMGFWKILLIPTYLLVSTYFSTYTYVHTAELDQAAGDSWSNLCVTQLKIIKPRIHKNKI